MKRNPDQLAHAANIVADIVTNTDAEQRHELYEMIALKLSQRCQNYSAKLFDAIAKHDRG
jgi:hypothetical protein